MKNYELSASPIKNYKIMNCETILDEVTAKLMDEELSALPINN